MKLYKITVLVVVTYLVTAEAKSKKKSKSDADAVSKTTSSAIIAIQIVDPNENKTSSKNYKRTIDSSLGYGYQSFLGPTHQQPRYEVYKYSQHDIPAFKGSPYIPFGIAKINIQKSISFQLPPITQYVPPGTTLFSSINQNGHVSGLSSKPPPIQQPSHQPVPVVILRIYPSQLKDTTNALYPNLPRSHPLASRVNSIDIQSLLLNYVRTLPQTHQQPQKTIQNYLTSNLQKYQPSAVRYQQYNSLLPSPVPHYHQPATTQYQAPIEQYNEVPIQKYQVPVEQYQGPVQQYQGPVQQYQAPVQQYSVPVQQYQQYQPPVQQYSQEEQQYQEPDQKYLPQHQTSGTGQEDGDAYPQAPQQYDTPAQEYVPSGGGAQYEQQEPQYERPVAQYYQTPEYLPQQQYKSVSVDEKEAKPYSSSGLLTHENYPSEKHTRVIFKTQNGDIKVPSSDRSHESDVQTKTIKIHVPSDVSQVQVQESEVPYDYANRIPEQQQITSDVDVDRSQSFYYFQQNYKENPPQQVYQSPVEKGISPGGEDKERPTRNSYTKRRVKKRKTVSARTLLDYERDVK